MATSPIQFRSIGASTEGGGDEVPPDINSRLAKLEGEVGGLKHGQTQLLVAVGIVAAFVIGFGFYTIQRVDALNEKVNAIPAQISSDIRDITKTIAESITAAKQQPPQVILLPAPSPPPPNTQK